VEDFYILVCYALNFFMVIHNHYFSRVRIEINHTLVIVTFNCNLSDPFFNEGQQTFSLKTGPGMVVHIYHPSYSRRRGKRIQGLPQGEKCSRPYLKNNQGKKD
jgi:hypothetical protein